MAPIIMILIGLAIAYASYLHANDHLIPKQRGRHYKGVPVRELSTKTVQFRIVSNLNYIRTGR